MQFQDNIALAHNPSQPILQSCLSTSWGGLEMVAFENAATLEKNHFQCFTLCIENSPLELHLRAAHLPTLTLKTQRHFFDFLKVRHFLHANGIKTVLVQRLKDFHILSFSLLNDDDIKVVAVSHSFLAASKKDLAHRWTYSKIHKLVCMTSLHKDNVLNHLPLSAQQIEVIPNYVDCELYHPRNRCEKLRQEFGAGTTIPLFGIASRLDPQKGQDYALAAIALLKLRNISAR